MNPNVGRALCSSANTERRWMHRASLGSRILNASLITIRSWNLNENIEKKQLSLKYISKQNIQMSPIFSKQHKVCNSRGCKTHVDSTTNVIRLNLRISSSALIWMNFNIAPSVGTLLGKCNIFFCPMSMTFDPKWHPAMTLGSVSDWKGF